MIAPAVTITQKLLVNAGGWPAMKQAQQLQSAGRVTEAAYDPPLLSGMVREGNRNLRSGLRVRSESDVENLCTCRESREWGKICPHALAVGLQYIAEQTVPQKIAAAPKPETVARPAGPVFLEHGSAEAIPLALHFILPPNFDSAWAKGQIMLVTEVELNGRRVMPGALLPNERYACDAFDLAALEGLRRIAGDEPALTPMRLWPREEFLRLLEFFRGHPRVSFGKSNPVEVSGESRRPRLVLSREDNGSIRAELELLPNERFLAAGDQAWLLESARFRPLPANLPAHWRELMAGTIVLHGERALHFLAFEAPALAEWFEVETIGEWVLPQVERAFPHFGLQIEGSLRELRAKLRADYPDGPKEIGPAQQQNEPELIRDPENSGRLLLRDREAEAEALRRLENLGFTARGEVLVLTNENAIARFFAFDFPRLEKEWTVQLSGTATKAHRELQPLAPKIEIVGSGENWFELRYSLGTPDGGTFSAAELQRLLRSGQTKTRLQNGRTAVFDPEAIADFEEVLRDCEPEQKQPGTYRIDRAHASYVVHTAAELGLRLQALTDTRNANVDLSLGQIGDRLREYQRDGVKWLWHLAANKLGGILADEMGLGKTVQALAFLEARRTDLPALIVCPTSLLSNWQNEAQRWTPTLRLLRLDGPERHARFAEIEAHDLVLTSYSLLQRDAEKYRPFEFSSAILDEAQHIKNPDTQNARAAFGLRARHRFVLTGTPMENSVRDLWSLMNFALPGYLGSRSDFRERYELLLARGAAPEVQNRLARRMRPFLLRRKKSEVAKELPEKIEQVLTCDLNPAQRAAYDGLLREIQTGLTSDKSNAGAVRMKMLLGLLRLRQVCCDLRLLGSAAAGPAVSHVARDSSGRDELFREAQKGAGEDARAPQARRAAPTGNDSPNESSAKLELLGELLEEAIDGGHRVLIFSQFVSMLALIRGRLEKDSIRFAYLDGQTKERQAVVDQFQKESAIPVFLMSLKAGGVGLNLSAADTVIHFDPWWNYAAEAQATDRAHRIGQTRVVTAYKLIARDTVEEKIVKLQARKRSASEGLIGSEEPLMSGLTSEELEELLS